MTDTDIDWASLETHVTADGTFAPPVRATTGTHAKTSRFPCTNCGGSGIYRGVRRHQPESRCFACNGKGYFMTSEADRAKARITSHDRKARKLSDDRAAFNAANPGISTFLLAATWSSFAQELAVKLDQYGSLSERQVAAVRSMQAARATERAANRQEVDLSAIRAMFETAVRSGHQRPIYRAADLVISRAPDHGKNPGALYVKTVDDEYLGKILGTVYSGKPATALAAIAADPRGEAVRYGQRTGTCSCCGRTLTDGNSIAAGIGPICAAKWGL